MVQHRRDTVARRAGVATPRRGDVYIVTFDPTVGAEIKKMRPAVVIQNDIANRWSPVTIVASISSRLDETVYPTEVRVDPPEGSLTTPSVVLLNQIRSVDRRRMVKRIGRLRPDTMKLVNRAIQVSLGLAGV